MRTPSPTPPETLRDRLARPAAAIAVALVIHGGVALLAETSTPRVRFLYERDSVELFEWVPPEVKAPPEPVEEPPLDPTPEPEERSEPDEPPPPEPEQAEPEPDLAEPPPDAPEAELPESPEVKEAQPAEPARAPVPIPEPVVREGEVPDSVVRLPKGSGRPGSLMGRVMGSGGDPFGTGLGALEEALEYKADAPVSDAKRAARTATRGIQEEMAHDLVAAGLADDYFRELKLRLENSWRPAAKDLNDGGESTDRMGFMKDFTVNRAAWGEVFRIYQDMASQYAKAETVRIPRDRVKMARELFRSKKGNFRVQAIAEIVLTQAPDGKVLTIEFIHPTGHDGIDEGIKDAIKLAVSVMPYEPPERLSIGRSFRSKWRMRATWRMIPPTALLSGNSWDLSARGVEVDVPFEVKLSTNVMLMSFDNTSRSIIY